MAHYTETDLAHLAQPNPASEAIKLENLAKTSLQSSASESARAAFQSEVQTLPFDPSYVAKLNAAFSNDQAADSTLPKLSIEFKNEPDHNAMLTVSAQLGKEKLSASSATSTGKLDGYALKLSSRNSNAIEPTEKQHPELPPLQVTQNRD
jgi:hypothetical protein